MAAAYFFTGFPGFIASSLIRQLIRDGYDANQIYLLVLPEQVEKAKKEIEKIVLEESVGEEIFSLISGDITRPNLGIDSQLKQELQEKVNYVYHLAAIYDLAVPEGTAFNVNVKGTINVNNWVLSLESITRYVYFSTAYVSGTREGTILETELERKQNFKNHYERTKFQAELAVQSIKGDVPVTIIRPGIVKGNSKTGETIKFDGPYFILNTCCALRFLPAIPYLGTGEADGNFVPVDYVLNAAIYLGHTEAGVGKTYHLTDPNPYKMKEVYRMLMKEYLGKEPAGTIPLALSKLSLSVPAVRKWMKVEKEAMDYFSYQAEYDNTEAQRDLAGSDISCPDFATTLKPMVHYYKQHENDSDKHIKIK